MTRILAYTAPFTMPYVVLLLIRLFYFAAGVEQPKTDDVVFVSAWVGLLLGCVVAVAYIVEKLSDE